MSIFSPEATAKLEERKKRVMQDAAATIKKVENWKKAHDGYPILPEALAQELKVAELKVMMIEGSR